MRLARRNWKKAILSVHEQFEIQTLTKRADSGLAGFLYLKLELTELKTPANWINSVGSTNWRDVDGERAKSSLLERRAVRWADCDCRMVGFAEGFSAAFFYDENAMNVMIECHDRLLW